MKETSVWGFTRGERNAILLVCAGALIGLGYRFYQRSAIPPIAPIPAQDSAAMAAIERASMPQGAIFDGPVSPDSSAAPLGSSSDLESAAQLDLNGATQAQLEALPGIGPVLAKRILETRAQLGGFQRLEELLEVPGIGRGRLEQIRRQVTCGASRLSSNSNIK